MDTAFFLAALREFIASAESMGTIGLKISDISLFELSSILTRAQELKQQELLAHLARPHGQ